VKPDRVVFNALIAACAQSGAVDRAFDVLAEMAAEMQPMDPDHVTIGALLKACTKAGQVLFRSFLITLFYCTLLCIYLMLNDFCFFFFRLNEQKKCTRCYKNIT